jgi:hypothetical protein
LLAAEAANLKVSANAVCALLLEGYRAGVRAEGNPILLSDGPTPSSGQTDEGYARRPKDFLEKEARPNDNPKIDAGELPKGLEDMFRASFRPGAIWRSASRSLRAAWVVSAGGASPPWRS